MLVGTVLNFMCKVLNRTRAVALRQSPGLACQRPRDGPQYWGWEGNGLECPGV